VAGRLKTPRPSARRAFASPPKWKSVLDGSSWSEKEVAKLTDQEVGDASREKLTWRLVAYLRQGNSKEEALRRLKDSLSATPDTSAPLAIVTRDDVG
jgi:hypothetical protein